MNQPILTRDEYRELWKQVGWLNARHSRNPALEYTGKSIIGLMMTDPNYGSVSFHTDFPHMSPSQLRGKQNDEMHAVHQHVSHTRVLETSPYAGMAMGSPSPGNPMGFLPQFPGGVEQFAAAVQSITRIPIEWRFVTMKLVHPGPNRHDVSNGQLLQVLPPSDPPVLLAHEGVFLNLRQYPDGVGFGSGQRIEGSRALLVSMHCPSVCVPVQILGSRAEGGGSWFRYQVKGVKAA